VLWKKAGERKNLSKAFFSGISRSEMTKKRWGLDATGAFVLSGISRSEMTKKRWGLDATGAFVLSGISRNGMTKAQGNDALELLYLVGFHEIK